MSELTASDRASSRSAYSTRQIACMAMLCALAYLVMYLSKTIFAPIKIAGFLTFDLKDVVIAIGGFLFGPLSAFVVSVVVSLIEMVTVSETGPVGLLMNVLSTVAFVCPAAFLYRRRHQVSGAVAGLVLGGLLMTGTMLLWNYLITPLYMTGYTRADVAALLPTLFFPFNLAKGGMNMAATLLLYAPVVTAMRKAGVVPPSQSSQEKKINAGFVLFSLALLATFVLFALVLAGVI